MEKHISQNALQTFYSKELKILGKQGIKKKIEKRRSEATIGGEKRKTIFLSHSHLDKTIVTKIGLLFDKLNTELYVDWLDGSLPPTTNIQTAEVIKTKIQVCHYFLFLATVRGLSSKWCNWEIGVADVLKGKGKLAVLPIESKGGNWSGNEYLQLYPEMKFETEDLDSLNVNQVTIQQANGEPITLDDWLRN